MPLRSLSRSRLRALTLAPKRPHGLASVDTPLPPIAASRSVNGATAASVPCSTGCTPASPAARLSWHASHSDLPHAAHSKRYVPFGASHRPVIARSEPSLMAAPQLAQQCTTRWYRRIAAASGVSPAAEAEPAVSSVRAQAASRCAMTHRATAVLASRCEGVRQT